MLKVDNITISYKGNPVVKNFSMAIEEGKIISLVGESGSGKTSVIRSFFGLLTIGGEVYYLGRRITSFIFCRQVESSARHKDLDDIPR